MVNQEYKKMLDGKSVIRELSEYATKRGKEIGYDNVFDFSLGNPSVPVPESFTRTMQLTERKMTILNAIVRNYLATGEPVGSRTISKEQDLNLSSATIRNEMADLEEMGLIMLLLKADRVDLAQADLTSTVLISVIYSVIYLEISLAADAEQQAEAAHPRAQMSVQAYRLHLWSLLQVAKRN